MTMTKSERILYETLLLQPRANDSLVVNDAALLAAIERRKPLSKQQAQQLAASPLTLRRFRQLCLQQKQAASLWQHSEGTLMAAASEDALESLTTEDGLWRLYFMYSAEDRISLIVKCLGDTPLIEDLWQRQCQIQVLDKQGKLLCSGILDDDAEFRGEWPMPESPRTHFQASGSVFYVRPAPISPA